MISQEQRDIMTSPTIALRDYQSETEVTGRVTRLWFTSDTFSAGLLYTQDGPIWDRDIRFSIKAKVAIDDELTLIGNWNEDAKYGWQFVANRISYPMPDMSVEGLSEYLANTPCFKGIGPQKARLIAEHFGDQFDSAIRESPEEVARIGKLTPKQLQTLQTEWTARTDLNAISTWLSAYGLTHSQCKRIAERYGNQAQSILTENPYLLIKDVNQIGFARADEIALKMGIDPHHPGRIKACLIHLVQEEADSGGHTYIGRLELIKSTIAKLHFDSLQADRLIREQLKVLTESESELVEVNHDGKLLIANRFLYEREMQILHWLTESAQKPAEWYMSDVCSRRPLTDDDLHTCMGFLSATGAHTPSTEQEQAILMTLRSRISILTGGAGTGKSYTISSIYKIFTSANLKVGLCAPTGKAAKRMEQLVGEDSHPCTIHRFLSWDPFEQVFKFNSKNQLPYDLIIVDEVSMCDVNLLYHLFSAIDFSNTQLLLVGDHNQLPPIGPGNVLRDALDTNIVPSTILQHCHRQAGVLRLNCHNILSGNLKPTAPSSESSTPVWQVMDGYEDSELLVAVLRKLLSQYVDAWGYDLIKHVMLVTPYNKGKLGVNRLNLECQRIYQMLHHNVNDHQLPIPTPETWDKRGQLLLHDRVMQIKNDYKLGVMNGAVGVVVDVKEDRSKDEGVQTIYSITFDDDNTVEIKKNSDQAKNIVLAYAATVHKLQGSEYPLVVSIIHKTHTYMLSRNLLYTAATRARSIAILIGDKLGMRRAMRNVGSLERRTWLGLLGKRLKSITPGEVGL